MTTFAEFQREEVRLIILRLLAEDMDVTLADRALKVGLKHFGYNEALETIHEHLVWLEGVKAVSLQKPAEGVIIATLEQAGRGHLERSKPIAGVRKPSKPIALD
jgi:hypothetical protein